MSWVSRTATGGCCCPTSQSRDQPARRGLSVIVSLNEIAATAAKAVRGCGHPEGIAEEMGFAARWLCERDLPGLELLLAALDDASTGGTAVGPVAERQGDVLTLRTADRSPLPLLRAAPSAVELVIAGSPHPDNMSQSYSVELDAVTHPLLLVPFVARNRSRPSPARWMTADGPVVVEPCGTSVRIRAEHRSSLVAEAGRQVVVGSFELDGSPPVIITSDDLDDASRRSIANGCLVDHDAWEQLGELATRTYVAVSEISRRRGAGAGLIDND